MRQTLVLNLVVLGFFVFLFFSIYRKRKSPQLALWIAAYLFAMAHFASGLWTPAGAALQAISGSIFLAALMLCGVCFLLSHPAFAKRQLRSGMAAWLGGSCLLFSVAVDVDGTPKAALFPMLVLLQGAGGYYLWRLNRGRPVAAATAGTLLLLCTGWCGLLLHRNDLDGLVAVLLMELYGFCALVFASGFGRRSAGAWTAIFGLTAWAAVFPAGMLQQIKAPHAVIDPEIWNVPKVVVAFGLLVMIFEDEVALARRDREQYRHLFDSNPTPMWIFEKDSMQLLEANGAAVRTFGWRHVDLPSLTIQDLLVPADREDAEILELNRRLNAEEHRGFPMAALEGEVRATTAYFQTRRGEEVIVEATLQRAKYLGEEARLLMAKDVTAQVRTHELLVHQANHDPLTGLPNRLLLEDRLQAALALALRHGSHAAVLCLDLDRFKQINDTFGHTAGDSCLREVAARLLGRLRAVDTAARTGGEEFMVVLNDIHGLEDAARVADQLLVCLSVPHVFEGESIALSASIGVAMFPDHGERANELWQNADAAMYRAKQSGGNRHNLFSMAS